MAHRTDENGSSVRHAFLIGLSPQDWLAALLLFAVAALTLFVVSSRWPQTPDGLFHLQRVRSLGEALDAGVLLPRWFPDFAFEYGHPILNYYAPAFYYPPALLHLVSLSVIDATRVTLSLLFGFSGVAMYALLRVWVSLPAALVGSVFYLAFPYRLYDLFIRGALPEFAAFLWLPLILLVAVAIGQSLQRRSDETTSTVANRFPNAGSLLAASTIWAALILTHNLTAMMAGLTLAGLLIVFFLVDRFSGRQSRSGWQSIAWGLAPILLGAMLVAWYVIPALSDSAWVGIGAEPASTGYANHFVRFGQLFDWSPIYAYPSAAESIVPLPGYVLVLIVVCLLLLPMANRSGLIQPLVAGLTMSIVAIWLTTESSAFLWNVAAPVLGKLQFPWRWQTIIALGTGLLAALIMEMALRSIRLKGGRRSVVGWTIVAVAICFVTVSGVVGLDYPQATYTDDDITRQQMWAFDAEFGQIGMTWTGEFLPRWVSEQRWAIGREPSDGSSTEGLPSVDLTISPQQLGYANDRYRVEAIEPATLIWHRFYFPSWQVTLDGASVEAFPSGDLGLLSIVVPPGEHDVAVRWSATMAVQVGRVLSLFGWMALAAMLWLGHVRRHWTVGWLLVGFVLLAAGFFPAKQVAPHPIGADYGALRLESSLVESANVGEIVNVQLHWLVVEPSPPLNAFVHVVDGTGAIVAQNDAPLAGDYTPWQRWTPGLLLQHSHAIPLPADLLPGDYLLKAGVYEPGRAGDPLLPDGQSDPRVDIGWLEVRP